MLQEFFPVLDGVPMADLWVLLALGFMFMAAWMFIMWLWHVKRKNAGIADFGWASGIAILGAFYAIYADGYGPRRALIGLMVFIWGLRLGWHLFSDRILGEAAEDPRYTALREKWQTSVGIRFLLLFEFRAVLAVFLSIPMALLAIDPLQQITGYEWFGLALWIVALWGETVADTQLKHFKADPDNQGLVCQVGLWNYSRHPNYFFEWLIWVAYFIAALSTAYGAWTLVCPLVMLLVLHRAMRNSEEHAALSRGEPYLEYQATTSRFIPWVKKNLE